MYLLGMAGGGGSAGHWGSCGDYPRSDHAAEVCLHMCEWHDMDSEMNRSNIFPATHNKSISLFSHHSLLNPADVRGFRIHEVRIRPLRVL
eukprot:scaffold173887_cov22-Prasinocladus_malaysianus.AAC.1